MRLLLIKTCFIPFNRLKYGLLLFLGGLAIGCAEADPNAGRTKLARVGDKYLYLDELVDDVPNGLSKEDSAQFVHGYVDRWLREESMMQKAREELPEEAQDVKQQLEDYEKSLIMYAYEKQLIKRKLDTVVSQTEIQEYYEKHQENFKLQDYIVKVLYVKVPQETPKVEDLRKWYGLRNDGDVENVLNFASVHAENYYYDENKWVYFDDVLKVIPLSDINKLSFIRNKQKVTFEEGGYVYFLNILDYKLKDAVSPLSLEREKIKSIILNIRANELKKNIREELYNEAKSRQIIETF